MIIAVEFEKRFGQFVFPKSVLIDKAIISTSSKDGKRGIRVYPIWDEATNKQAQKTQKWQLEFFIELSDENNLDLEKARKLYTSG